jgi:spore maturation protein CgeB
MKIAVFDTNNHPTPILKEWGIGFLDLGHDVDFYPIEHYNITACTNKLYDLIVYVGNMNVHDFELVKQYNPNVRIVCAADSVQLHFHQFVGLIDFFITTQHSSPSLHAAFKQIGFNLHYVPLAGNDHLFYPIDIENKYDICFIGTLAHGYREEDKYLYPFIDKYKFYLAGMQYNNHGISFLPYDQANVIRNSSTININFHYDYQRPNEGTPSDRIDLNQSVYNIALSGAFQICDHTLVADLFDNNIIVDNHTNWPELIEYYIHNHEERNKLAKKAYDIAIKDHTWKARMREFLKLLNTI